MSGQQQQQQQQPPPDSSTTTDSSSSSSRRFGAMRHIDEDRVTLDGIIGGENNNNSASSSSTFRMRPSLATVHSGRAFAVAAAAAASDAQMNDLQQQQGNNSNNNTATTSAAAAAAVSTALSSQHQLPPQSPLPSGGGSRPKQSVIMGSKLLNNLHMRPSNNKSQRFTASSYASNISNNDNSTVDAVASSSSFLHHHHHHHPNNSNKHSNTSTTAAASRIMIERQQQLNRRYAVQDPVLLQVQHSRWSTPVNEFGFPAGEGNTPSELQGPYLYVLCRVQQVHFDEIRPYYSVVRADTGVSIRGDADKMKPVLSSRGEQAALRASTTYAAGNSTQQVLVQDERSEDAPPNWCAWLGNACFCVLLPLYALIECLLLVYRRLWLPCWAVLSDFTRKQARLFLNGMDPYVCRVRITLVNFVVICSTWYMFIDQARLVFFPPAADDILAHVNFAVWIVLVVELVAEVFVRPDGYRSLIVSDRAYAPTTVRYINSFHLVIETLSLVIFIPEWYCLFSNYQCDDSIPWSFHNAAYIGVTGPTRFDSFRGRCFLCFIRLRVFGLVRHWKNMWITTTFIRSSSPSIKSVTAISSSSATAAPKSQAFVPSGSLHSTSGHGGSGGGGGSTTAAEAMDEKTRSDSEKKDLTNASTIGTALMATNSYRALIIVWLITGVFPLFLAFGSVYHNQMSYSMTNQLQGSNVLANDSSNETCAYLTATTVAWVTGVTSPDFSRDGSDPYVLSLELKPERCAQSWYRSICDSFSNTGNNGANLDREAEQTRAMCQVWREGEVGKRELADALGLRAGSIANIGLEELSNFTSDDGVVTEMGFSVNAFFDETYTVRTAAFSSLLLQACMLIFVLGGLSVLRTDAEILVLGPLRRMLKIVARYAKNPLVQPKVAAKGVTSRRRFLANRGDGDNTSSSSSSDESDNDEARGDDGLALGSYETTQLITAVTKITALLRKCWGVAGADIISTNLETRKGALTEVFNPTVKGRSVYALFGFAGIDGFDHALRNLGGDVMILINDVAAVLHGEVFRWGLHDSGQCNKNLGAAFLMVFRIGLVTEVTRKLEQATDVIFSTTSINKTSRAKRRVKGGANNSGNSNKVGRSVGPVSRVIAAKRAATHLGRKSDRSSSVKAMSLSLASLPGISTFTDRAVIGMLKSFAGVHRDSRIRTWNNDFRLGAGVGAFTVSMSIGMDAGWAVEGAVGSEYKIDATYLSPHVNMASRMMGASKQYGVSIMLSQAVQELMSDVARSKLRHLDTVTVKGSLLKQNIYTFDARYKGVDFFLKSRSDEQADYDAERYSPNIWNTDPDLTAMRQHVTEDFLKAYGDGRKAYITGDWPRAISKFERANEIMMETVFEEGYLENELEELQLQAGDDQRAAAEALKRETGDGPSLLLISYMKSEGGSAPPGWEGWHPLTRK